MLMRKFAILGVALAALCLLPIANSAKADVIWTLTDVPFTDGGTLSGTFTIDTSYGGLTTWALTTTAGNPPLLPGTSYGTLNFDPVYETALGAPNGAPLNAVDVSDKTIGVLPSFNSPYQGELFLQFQNSLSTPGINPIVYGYECFGFSCYPTAPTLYLSDIRFVGVGADAVGAVPEASTWVMLLLGFISIGLMTGRRNSARELRLLPLHIRTRPV
jgi:hypothetical protein